jgi:hypothetical protein
MPPKLSSTTTNKTATRSALTTDDISSRAVMPTPSPTIQPGAPSETAVLVDEMMKRMAEMMHFRDKKYDEERERREKVASEEKEMLLKLVEELKEKERKRERENEETKLQLNELMNRRESQANMTPVKASSQTVPIQTLLSPENQQKLKNLAFTIRSIDFDRKKTKNEYVDIDEHVAKQATNQFYDSTEEKVKKREREHVDKVIYEDEASDETHLQSYIKWLEQREKQYPYAVHMRQLYKRRYTLLSPWGRYSEWLRTGFYLGFPISLYGVTINRWYLYQLQTAGITTDTNFRKVSDKVLMMPAMSYDERDVRPHATSEEMEDILPNSNVLRSLPLPLRYTPDLSESEKYTISSLQEYTKHMLKLKLQRIRLLRYDSVSSSTSSTSENDLEAFDCAMCGREVRNRPYSDVCVKCEVLRKRDRLKVKLEGQPSVQEKTELPKLEKVEEKFDHTQEMYNKIKNLVREEREGVPAMPTLSVIKNTAQTHDVLGRVLNELFTPSARRTLELTRLPKLTSSTEITRATTQLVTDVGKFDGDVSVAPRWLHEYCRGVYRYSFDVPNCLYVITKCFIGEAKAWLDQMLDKVSLLHESTDTSTRPIEALLLLYKQQYMGQTQISMWKKQLAGTKLTSTAATVTDLKSHYKTFVTLVNNLRLCDKYVSEEEYRTMYMDALPYSVSLYIGRDYQKFTTLDEIFQIATEAIVKQNIREKKPSDGGLAPRKETLNIMYTSEGEEVIPYHALTTKRSAEDPQQRWKKLNTARMTCFHCGKNGHAAFECQLLAHPQTALGAAAWAQRNLRMGMNQVYDVTKYTRAKDTSSVTTSTATTRQTNTSENAMPASSREPARKRLFKKGQKKTTFKDKVKETTRNEADVEEVSDD